MQKMIDLFRAFFVFINTIKYLKLSQIFYRLRRKLVKPKISDEFKDQSLNLSKKWKHVELYERKIFSSWEACFLNHKKSLNFPSDWNSELPSKLWTYNLHYFEDLIAEDANKYTSFYQNLIDIWINQNPVGVGNGWEAYPSSLRIVNILKAALGGFELNKKMLNSIFTQASYLSNNLDKHLLGNHYFVNLKALLFSGVLLRNPRWTKLAVDGLLAEIPEQILEDGANFELSPMYHSLMLIDTLDMLNLIRAYPCKNFDYLKKLLEEIIPKMLDYLVSMTHPDGSLSFFNDSANGIAPSFKKINDYCVKLGFSSNLPNSSLPQLTDNFASGYFTAKIENNKLIFDAAKIGADYIPGHAHADTLSFELSISKQRVLVNSGTSEYSVSAKRLKQRQTSSHNTVEIDNKDSSQVWSSFRVANRAKVVSRSANLNNGNEIILRATHDGYNKLFRECFHTRKIVFRRNSLLVKDNIQGEFTKAKSRFYFHPGLNLSLIDGFLRVQGSTFLLCSDLTNHVCTLRNSFWYPEFGLEVPNKVLEIEFTTGELELTFGW